LYALRVGSRLSKKRHGISSQAWRGRLGSRSQRPARSDQNSKKLLEALRTGQQNRKVNVQLETPSGHSEPDGTPPIWLLVLKLRSQVQNYLCQPMVHSAQRLKTTQVWSMMCRLFSACTNKLNHAVPSARANTCNLHTLTCTQRSAKPTSTMEAHA
jgi:hypothetical protein